jgi:hypothetical protein
MDNVGDPTELTNKFSAAQLAAITTIFITGEQALDTKDDYWETHDSPLFFLGGHEDAMEYSPGSRHAQACLSLRLIPSTRARGDRELDGTGGREG